MLKVLPLGIKYDEFWTLNPHKVEILILSYNELKKNEMRMQNTLFHLQGQYFCEALLTTVGNMFKSKGQRPYEYPKEPYTLNLDYEKGLDLNDERQREIARKRSNFVANLNKMFGEIDRTLQERNNGYR